MNKESAALSHIHGKHGTLCFVKSTLPWLIRFNVISLGSFFIVIHTPYATSCGIPCGEPFALRSLAVQIRDLSIYRRELSSAE